MCLSSVKGKVAFFSQQSQQPQTTMPMNKTSYTGAQWGMAPEPQTGRRVPTLDELTKNNPDRLIERGHLNLTTGSSGGINTPTQPQVDYRNTCGNTGAIRNDQGICVCQNSTSYNQLDRRCVQPKNSFIGGNYTIDNLRWAANVLAEMFGQIDMRTGQRIS
jgi:hypothetical protein